MCLVIDKFINKDFKAGITLVDDDYSKEYKLFNTKISSLKDELKEISWDLEKELIDDLDDKLKDLLNTDKKYLYEGIL